MNSKSLAIELTSLMNEVEYLEQQDKAIPDSYFDRISLLRNRLASIAPELIDPRITDECQ